MKTTMRHNGFGVEVVGEQHNVDATLQALNAHLDLLEVSRRAFEELSNLDGNESLVERLGEVISKFNRVPGRVERTNLKTDGWMRASYTVRQPPEWWNGKMTQAFGKAPK